MTLNNKFHSLETSKISSENYSIENYEFRDSENGLWKQRNCIDIKLVDIGSNECWLGEQFELHRRKEEKVYELTDSAWKCDDCWRGKYRCFWSNFLAKSHQRKFRRSRMAWRNRDWELGGRKYMNILFTTPSNISLSLRITSNMYHVSNYDKTENWW